LAELSLADLQQRATLIAEVKATAAEVVDHSDLPFTLVTCQVRRSFKGEPAGSFMLAVPGGKRGDLTMKVPGATIPEVGDVFIVFAETGGPWHRGQFSFRPLGLGQGIFALIEHRGVTYAVQALARAPENLRACADDWPTCRSRLGVPAYPLDELAAQLRRR
jgi:hypothetical protein